MHRIARTLTCEISQEQVNKREIRVERPIPPEQKISASQHCRESDGMAASIPCHSPSCCGKDEKLSRLGMVSFELRRRKNSAVPIITTKAAATRASCPMLRPCFCLH